MSLKHENKRWDALQYKYLLFASWMLPGIKIKDLLSIRLKNIKWTRMCITFKFSEVKTIGRVTKFWDTRYPVGFKNQKHPPEILPLIRDLINHVSVMNGMSFGNKNCYLFPTIRGTYTRNGDVDITRKLRFHLPIWGDIYNAKLKTITSPE